MTSMRPWNATLTARVSRARDLENTEIVEYGHGMFTRRLLGPGGPLANPIEVLDEQACRDLLEELCGELDGLPADLDRDDVTAFARLLEGSLAMAPAA
ncbi:MAG TPA: hypothetical protein VGH76_08385 [Actinomycetospora sp.]|jgi:hypothetical protein|uniref:hypothetical protein n=1 Tax=Actinomycetospora sp. TaxID=1872135 RepID=UPI002F3EB2CF